MVGFLCCCVMGLIVFPPSNVNLSGQPYFCGYTISGSELSFMFSLYVCTTLLSKCNLVVFIIIFD